MPSSSASTHSLSNESPCTNSFLTAGIAQPGQHTLSHRVLARAYADDVIAVDAARIAVLNCGQGNRYDGVSDEAKQTAIAVRELPGGATTVRAPTCEFLELARQQFAPDASPVRQLAIAIMLEEYARQLVAEARGNSAADVEHRAHRETRLRRRRHYDREKELGLRMAQREEDHADDSDN